MSENKSFEQALDMMLDDALEIVNEQDGQADHPINEIEFSDEHNAKMQQLFSKIRFNELQRSFLKYGKRVACVFLIALGISICSVDAWRTKFIKLFYDENAPNSDYSFNDFLSGYTDEYISLSYLPQGFELEKKSVTSRSVILHFTKDNLYLQVKMRDINTQTNTDTETATIEQITIQGYDAIGIYKDNLNQIIWSDNEKAFHIAGNLPKEEIEKIAKNCKKN